jgi:hypothetical protein
MTASEYLTLFRIEKGEEVYRKRFEIDQTLERELTEGKFKFEEAEIIILGERSVYFFFQEGKHYRYVGHIGDNLLGDFLYKMKQKEDKMAYFEIVKKDELLQKFADRVKEGHYKKIPYVEWRTLTENKTPPFLGIYTDLKLCEKTIYLVDICENHRKCKLIQSFHCADNSFGSFLFNEDDIVSECKVGNSQPVREGESIMSVLSNVKLVGVDLAASASSICSNTPCLTTSGTTYIIDGDYANSASSINIPYQAIQSTMEISNKCDKCENYKESKEMNTKNMFNFDFGPASSAQFRLSHCGLAISTKENGWITYDPKTGDLVDVNVINFDLSNLIYKMPVALAAIHPGDILMHSGKPVFVKSVNADNTITAIDYANATVSNILPVKSPFGFNFFTKVCALVDFSSMTASQDSPFGNMLPFLLLQNGEFDPMMMLLLMNGSGNMNFASNPMMLYLLAKDNKDMLPFLFMMSNPTTPNHEPQTI